MDGMQSGRTSLLYIKPLFFEKMVIPVFGEIWKKQVTEKVDLLTTD